MEDVRVHTLAALFMKRVEMRDASGEEDWIEGG